MEPTSAIQRAPAVGEATDKRADELDAQDVESGDEESEPAEVKAEDSEHPSDSSESPSTTSDAPTDGDTIGQAADTAQVAAVSDEIATPSTAVPRQPLTIETLNAVLLLGGQSPRFALVAPEQRPGASLTRSASESQVAGESRSRPNASRVLPRADQATRDQAEVSGPRAEPVRPSADGHEVRRENPDSPTRSATAEAKQWGGRVSPTLPGAVTRDGATSGPIGPSMLPVQNAPKPGGGERARSAVGPLAPLAGGRSVSSRSIEPTHASRAAPETDARAFERQIAVQLQRGVDEALRSPGQTLTLRLQPANLGQVRIQVKIDADQSLRAKFEVASAKTRSAMNGSMDELVRALEDKGLRVDDISVTLRPRLPERDLGLPPVLPEPVLKDAQSLPEASGLGFAEETGAFAQTDTGGARSDHSDRPPQDAGPWSATDSIIISPSPAEPALEHIPIGSMTGLIGSILHVAGEGRVRIDALA